MELSSNVLWIYRWLWKIAASFWSGIFQPYLMKAEGKFGGTRPPSSATRAKLRRSNWRCEVLLRPNFRDGLCILVAKWLRNKKIYLSIYRSICLSIYIYMCVCYNAVMLFLYDYYFISTVFTGYAVNPSDIGGSSHLLTGMHPQVDGFTFPGGQGMMKMYCLVGLSRFYLYLHPYKVKSYSKHKDIYPFIYIHYHPFTSTYIHLHQFTIYSTALFSLMI